MHGKYDPVSRPAQPGDLLKVDFKTDAPEELKEDPRAKYLVEGTNSWQIMREPESIPGITAALTGVSVGESKEVDVTFPGEAANEVYEQVVAAFQKQLDFPLPPALVARTMEEATRRMEEELKSRNLSPEELEKTRQERLENLQKEIPANLISEIRKNRGAWERMETDLRRQKAIALLVDNADVTIVGEDGQPLPPEEAAPAKEPAPAAAE